MEHIHTINCEANVPKAFVTFKMQDHPIPVTIITPVSDLKHILQSFQNDFSIILHDVVSIPTLMEDLDIKFIEYSIKDILDGKHL